MDGPPFRRGWPGGHGGKVGGWRGGPRPSIRPSRGASRVTGAGPRSTGDSVVKKCLCHDRVVQMMESSYRRHSFSFKDCRGQDGDGSGWMQLLIYHTLTLAAWNLRSVTVARPPAAGALQCDHISIRPTPGPMTRPGSPLHCAHAAVLTPSRARENFAYVRPSLMTDMY